MPSLVLVTDAWQPQVNGVVRTLNKVVDGMRSRGVCVTVISPLDFRSVPCPSYPEIRLAITTRRAVMRRLEKAQPAYIHIATEGPLGILARRCCLARGWPFTTSFHTKFPEYLRERLPVPRRLSYFLLRRFHNAAHACLVPTPSIDKELKTRGFTTTRLWTRGVDRALFHPGRAVDLGLPKPVFLCVGRVAPEKNLEAFLSLDLPGTKLVVGDGPQLEKLKLRFPETVFLGQKTGVPLAEIFAGADVFVFPSRTDTFGLVLLEALASGLPVAAFPVPGPIDVVMPGKSGFISEDLRQAALDALTLGRVDPDECLANFTWESCVDIFADCLSPLPTSRITAQTATAV
jgi:glycosyltransferase involved in cell wall biosynthesis